MVLKSISGMITGNTTGGTGKYADNNYDSFWASGGGLDSDYCPYQGEWIINENDIPDGCCGGCA